ncbi:MAG: BTAD domain-containing putative transcriptional regulator [Umezawaea sp.]
MQRGVLALLALDPGRVVSVERLVDGLWGEEPPDRCHGLIQSYVSRLRTVLRPTGATITRHGGGYLLDVEPTQVDLHEFRATADQARTGNDPHSLRSALRLWRGDPLGGLPSSPLVEQIRVGMAEERLVVWEECLDRELRAGRHREVLGEASMLSAENPLREKPLALLLLALYRSGRQPEALQRYDIARRHLADELGLDPSPELSSLRSRILRSDPDLALVAAQAKQDRAPRLLPYDVVDFIGRTAELDRLAALAESTSTGVVIAAIDGMPGVGKTATAVHLAHALGDRFPDGQLFVDLHGFTPGRTPVDSGVALGTLLRAFGVPDDRIPADLDERSALWRGELAGRRVLIVLDNAADAAQIRPLIPGSPGSLVLITSRRRLGTLDGVTSIFLDVLPPVNALALFVAIAGRRVLIETEAVVEVLWWCGHLPLAVRIAAARIGNRQQHPVRHLADRLRAEHLRLAELSLDDRDVTVAFTLSYAELRPDQRRLFRLLGSHPDTDFDAPSAAALADLSVTDAEDLLDELLDTRLLLRHTDDRYTFHNLLRVYAGERSAAEDSEAERRAALARLLDHYHDTVVTIPPLTGTSGRRRHPAAVA